MNVEVVYPQEFDDRVNKYLYEKHADIQEFELDNQVISKWIQLLRFFSSTKQSTVKFR